MRLLPARAGTPLLVGPENTQADVGPEPASPPTDGTSQPEDASSPEPASAVPSPTAPDRASEGSDSTSTSRSSHTHKHPDSDPSTSAQSTATANSASSTFVTSASAAPSNDQQSTVSAAPPKIQFSSLAYLVPIFLLVAITFGVILYRKCRARKRTSGENGSDECEKSPRVSSPRGWRGVPVSEDEAEKDDIWSPGPDGEDEVENAGEAWRDVRLQESKSRPGLMDVTYGSGRGWFSSSKWKSARALAPNPGDSSDRVGSTSGGAGPTVKLVLPRSGATYQSLLPSSLAFRSSRNRKESEVDVEDAKNFGSKRSWKDIKAMAFRLTPSKKQLERTNSPNKRGSMHPPPTALPEAPEWIMPRATSPDRQVLSPPLHPHLFFHPPPLTSMTSLRLPSVTNTESEDAFTDTDTQIGSSAAGSRVRHTEKAKESAVSRQNQPHDPDATPKKVSIQGRSDGAAGDAKDSTPIQQWRVGLPVVPESPTRKRDTEGPGYMVNGTTGAKTPGSPKKSRKERRDQKARERVESILQASWSDRALSSPGASTTDLSYPVDTQQTRVVGQPSNREELYGGRVYGGIDARLAGIRQTAV